LWCQLLHGHRRRDVAPFGLGTCQQEDKCISNYDYSMGNTKASTEYSPHAGLGQRSSSSRRFELCLRGRSGLLGGRRGFFPRHRCRGLIPLPGQIC
jgi:hypothetical protein